MIMCMHCKSNYCDTEVEIRHRMCAACDEVNYNDEDLAVIDDVKNPKLG